MATNELMKEHSKKEKRTENKIMKNYAWKCQNDARQLWVHTWDSISSMSWPWLSAATWFSYSLASSITSFSSLFKWSIYTKARKQRKVIEFFEVIKTRAMPDILLTHSRQKGPFNILAWLRQRPTVSKALKRERGSICSPLIYSIMKCNQDSLL